MVVAATLGVASAANANLIEIGSISPPGTGAPGSTAGLVGAPLLSIFGGAPQTSGSGASMSGGDLTSLITQTGAVSGQVYVLAAYTANGPSLVVLAGGIVQTSVLTNTNGTGAFQTGGVNVSTLGGGGFSSIGTLNTSGGFGAFAYVGMPIFATTGSVTLFGQDSPGYVSRNATVNFLSWNGTGFTTVNSQNMDGSISFQFSVVPVPAPAAIAGLGLLGAGLLRRRMAKN